MTKKIIDLTSSSGGGSSQDIDKLKRDVKANTESIEGLNDKVDELKLFKFPNAIIIGEPTINNGQVSDFTTNDYLQFPFILDLHEKPFQIDFSFTTGNDVTTQQNILDSQFGIALAIENGRGIMAISHNGSSWAGVVTGNIDILPNTTYYARLSWNRINYKTEISTDGTTYASDMNFGSTQSPYPRTMFIGGCSTDAIAHAPHPFQGSINLNKAFLSVEDTVVWQGMDDAGLATKQNKEDSRLITTDKTIVGAINEVALEVENALGDIETALDNIIRG